MKNKNKPFFYEKKKASFRKILLILVICIGAILFYGFQIPSVRQIISEPLYAVWSFSLNTIKDFFKATRMYHEEPKPLQAYTPPELPSKEVLFAESLENLSEIPQADPLADLRQTPTPSGYARVAEWEYLDPNLNYDISSTESISGEETIVRLIPPVFEHADLFNDGAAILSADLRYWGKVENQYRVAETVHPDPADPVIQFSDLKNYVLDTYPDYSVITRTNGNKDILISVLKTDIPVIIRIQSQFPYRFWLKDDRAACKYILVHGYDSNEDNFYYSDAENSNTEEISADELLSAWYPFQRTYMLVFPNDRDENIQEALSENYYEELNLQQSTAKFRTDSEFLENNAFSQYNYGVMLFEAGNYEESYVYFRKAVDLSLPQRYLGWQTEMLDTLLRLGYADELSELIAELLNRNPHDETLTVYSGWAELLRGNTEEGRKLFSKAGKINPYNDTVRYALKYTETMIQ